jgi:hypothetical protein
MAVRVFDFWVHERDITTPLGLPTDDGDARAEMALAEVERSLGYIVGKKIGLPDGSSIVFHLTGPLRRDLYVTVDGRAKVVSHIDHPDVALSTDSVNAYDRGEGGTLQHEGQERVHQREHDHRDHYGLAGLFLASEVSSFTRIPVSQPLNM